jgi:hypothetical protein
VRLEKLFLQHRHLYRGDGLRYSNKSDEGPRPEALLQEEARRVKELAITVMRRVRALRAERPCFFADLNGTL